ncbi:MAG: metallophosphoesterase [Balneolaceae bacterium]
MFFKSVSILNVLVFCLAVLITHSVHAQKKVSVSDKEVNQSENIFRFAIMGDRTGGMRPGIFARAAEKVNIMQPEFILSVGDLVDGYTTEPEVWNAQWEEFDAIINKMDMPFYYVPGNHDISNDLLRDVWVKRHGSPYYTFVYKNVLFVSLHTEDRKGGGISEEQVAYINEQLEMHNDVRWTLIFMHRPIWSYGDQAGFEEIEASLKGRNYTLFSGHHHHYEYQKRNGMDHYILATTGGGSNLRGVEFGEFDHITWVTMKDNGPVVAHIEFDHIYDKDIVTTENKPMVQALRMGEWLKTSAIIVETSSVNTTQIPITLSNPVEHPIVVNGSLKDSLITFSPSDFELTIPANTDTTFSLAANWDEHISLHDLNEYAVQIILQGTYKQENEKDLSLPAKKRLVFDHPHDLEIIQKDITIDANLDDWNDLPFKNITNPVYMHEDWDWNGKEDGTFTFATQMDDKYIYVALKSDDDKLILENELGERQDKFFIRLNPFSAKNRKTEYPNRLFGFEQVADTLHYQIDIAQGKTIQKPNIQTNSEKVKVEAAMKSNRETGEQILEIAIPLFVVEDIQGKNWTSIRLNFGWMDHDRPENTKPSVLWWRPVWGSAQDDPGMGIFLKSQE